MGKKQSQKPKNKQSSSSGLSFVADSNHVDPGLASLFASSFGPVKAPERQSRTEHLPYSKDLGSDAEEDEEDDEILSSIDSEADETDDESEAGSDSDSASEDDESPANPPESLEPTALLPSEYLNGPSTRKRKRKAQEEEQIEDRYLHKVSLKEAEEEAKAEANRSEEREKKRTKPSTRVTEDEGDDEHDPDENDIEQSSSEAVAESDMEDDGTLSPIPQHESLAPSQADVELEKSARTVFLGNVSTVAITSKSARKTLLNHLSSFLPSLPSSKSPHKVESLRFRSTAYASALPKKAAFAKKELLDATTKSTNAYAVYSTQVGAREAAKRLNGTVVLDRHLRVDEIAHPAKIDHKRCVFVGNLGFVDDETGIQAAQEANGKPKQKQKEPADVEEGLWREFEKCGTVESVRVVRDSKTRVGKGFAYVQFTDENGVEAALLFNDKKFPPLLPRKLRVVRAKAVKRNKAKPAPSISSKNGIYNPKADPRKQSMQGRAGKLLGKAGAAQARHFNNSNPGIKPMESFVFEGHRASAHHGKSGQKSGRKGKKATKPANRSSRRAAAWKSNAGNKTE